MLQATTGFKDALRWGSYSVAAQLEIFSGGARTGILLPVSDGSFTVDRNSEQRRQGSITLQVAPTVPPQTVTIRGVSQALLPLSPQAALAPFGHELAVSLQVVGEGGSLDPAAWVPMGIFAIATATVEDSVNDLTVTLDLYDRSWVLSTWKLLAPYSVPASDTSLQGEVTTLLDHVWATQGPGGSPPWSYSIVPSGYLVPAGTYNAGGDPWQACLDMAASAGYELYFDVNGNVVGAPAPGSPASITYPTLNSIPISWNFDQNTLTAQGISSHPIGGTPYTTPVAMTASMTRDGVGNDFFVAATGANNATGSSTPVQARASDTNAQSPTYYRGGMGDSPSFIFDSLISSYAQALAEAQYQLALSLSKTWTLSVETPVNPLFDLDDVISITNPRLGLSGQKVIIDTISTSIRYDALTTLRGRAVVPGA